jgi:hypothetical protein
MGNVITTTYAYSNPNAEVIYFPDPQHPRCPHYDFLGHDTVTREVKDGDQMNGSNRDPRNGRVYRSITYQPGGSELARTETEWTSSYINGMPWVRKTAVTATLGSVSQKTTYDYATDHQNSS